MLVKLPEEGGFFRGEDQQKTYKWVMLCKEKKTSSRVIPSSQKSVSKENVTITKISCQLCFIIDYIKLCKAFSTGTALFEKHVHPQMIKYRYIDTPFFFSVFEDFRTRVSHLILDILASSERKCNAYIYIYRNQSLGVDK